MMVVVAGVMMMTMAVMMKLNKYGKSYYRS